MPGFRVPAVCLGSEILAIVADRARLRTNNLGVISGPRRFESLTSAIHFAILIPNALTSGSARRATSSISDPLPIRAATSNCFSTRVRNVT